MQSHTRYTIRAREFKIPQANNGLAKYVLNILNSRGENLVINGETIIDEAVKLETLIDLEKKFTNEKLPELRNFKVL